MFHPSLVNLTIVKFKSELAETHLATNAANLDHTMTAPMMRPKIESQSIHTTFFTLVRVKFHARFQRPTIPNITKLASFFQQILQLVVSIKIQDLMPLKSYPRILCNQSQTQATQTIRRAPYHIRYTLGNAHYAICFVWHTIEAFPIWLHFTHKTEHIRISLATGEYNTLCFIVVLFFIENRRVGLIETSEPNRSRLSANMVALTLFSLRSRKLCENVTEPMYNVAEGLNADGWRILLLKQAIIIVFFLYSSHVYDLSQKWIYISDQIILLLWHYSSSFRGM